MARQSRVWVGVLLVLAIAIFANLIALVATKPDITQGDGPFYVAIARNLADGKGFIDGAGFYPGKPTIGRAPMWPILLSVTARLAPALNDLALLRWTAACLNAATAPLLFGITLALSRRLRVAIAAGVSYAHYPVALALMVGGWSEIPYVFFAAGGLLLILRGGHWLYVGAVLLGITPLVRSNFIALPLMAGLVAMIRFKTAREWKRFIALAVLFWLPTALWIARNYRVTGEFPVLSTGEGEALYGANNHYIASTLSVWGYWVFPNEIPGETPKAELARTLSERQMDVYYHRKGVAYFKQHWFELPRLEVGKLIRAFVPVPWRPSWESYVVFFFRAILYVAALLSLGTFRRTDPTYVTIVTGMFLVVLLTVLVYYGTFRFTFCAEVFLLPAVVIGAFTQAGVRKKPSPVEPALLEV